MARPKKNLRDIPLALLSKEQHPDELKLRLAKLYRFAKSDKDDWDRKARRFYNAYLGLQWYYPDTGQRLPVRDWQVTTTRNYIFATVNSFKATMTDNRPHLYCVPRKPEDELTADEMSRVLDYVWYVANMDQKVVNVQTHSLISGMGFLKTYWDMPKDEIGVAMIDPFDLFIDPYAPADSPIQNARYLIQKFDMDIEEISRLYPKEVDKILAGGAATIDDIAAPSNPYDTVGRRAITESQDTDIQRFKGLEFWLKDTSTVPLTHDDGSREEAPLFPKGRVITMIGNVIVRDDKNPFDHGRFPYIEFMDHYVPGQVWHMGEVEQLEQPQIYINDLLSQILSNVKLMTNSQWIIEKGAVTDPNLITKNPGIVIETERGKINAIRKEPGVPLDGHIFQTLVDVQESISTVSGLSDYATGTRPTSTVHSSGVAIASVQEAAQAPIRMKVRGMETSLIELGMQFLGLIQQFYQPNRYVSLIANGQQTHIVIQQKHIESEFTIQVESGSTLPVNKVDKANQLMNIYDRIIQLGVLPPDQLARWLLEQIDIPGTYPLISLLKQASQSQPMAQMNQPGQMGQASQVSGVNPAETPALTQGGYAPGGGQGSVPQQQGAPMSIDELLASLTGQSGTIPQPS